MVKEPRIYGLLAEFDGPETLMAAAEKVREAGYRRTDAFSPFPIHGLADSLGLRKTRVAMLVLIGGIVGGAGRLHHAVLPGEIRLSVQHRRQAAQ